MFVFEMPLTTRAKKLKMTKVVQQHTTNKEYDDKENYMEAIEDLARHYFPTDHLDQCQWKYLWYHMFMMDYIDPYGMKLDEYYN